MTSQKVWFKLLTSLTALVIVSSLAASYAADKKKTQKKNTSNSATTLNLGKKLLSKNECLVCHSIKGSGGCLAPPFDGIGSRRSKGFLMSRITAEKKEEDKFFDLYKAQELMPHVRLSRKETTPIVAYLLTIEKPKVTPAKVVHELKTDKQKDLSDEMKSRLKTEPVSEKVDKEIALGKRLVAEKGCQACHSINRTGGTFGPELDHIGSKRSITYIADQIIAAEMRPTSEGKQMDRMPPLGLSLDEIHAIAKFLETLK